jgi:hypothetical protein
MLLEKRSFSERKILGQKSRTTGNLNRIEEIQVPEKKPLKPQAALVEEEIILNEYVKQKKGDFGRFSRQLRYIVQKMEARNQQEKMVFIYFD